MHYNVNYTKEDGSLDSVKACADAEKWLGRKLVKILKDIVKGARTVELCRKALKDAGLSGYPVVALFEKWSKKNV